MRHFSANDYSHVQTGNVSATEHDQTLFGDRLGTLFDGVGSCLIKFERRKIVESHFKDHVRNVCNLLLITPCQIIEFHFRSYFRIMELAILCHAETFGLPITLNGQRALLLSSLVHALQRACVTASARCRTRPLPRACSYSVCDVFDHSLKRYELCYLSKIVITP